MKFWGISIKKDDLHYGVFLTTDDRLLILNKLFLTSLKILEDFDEKGRFILWRLFENRSPIANTTQTLPKPTCKIWEISMKKDDLYYGVFSTTEAQILILK